MSESVHNANKRRLSGLRAILYDIDTAALRGQLAEYFTADCVVHLANPLEKMTGPAQLYAEAYAPLLQAVPDLERRDFIVMAGESNGQNWVGCCGHYMGVFERAWLSIPPTQHLMAMRYHEFFRLEDGQIVEMQALWAYPAGDDASGRLGDVAEPGGGVGRAGSRVRRWYHYKPPRFSAVNSQRAVGPRHVDRLEAATKRA